MGLREEGGNVEKTGQGGRKRREGSQRAARVQRSEEKQKDGEQSGLLHHERRACCLLLPAECQCLRVTGVNYGHKALRGPAVNHPCKRCPSLEAGDVYRRRPVPQSSLAAGGGGLRANRV